MSESAGSPTPRHSSLRVEPFPIDARTALLRLDGDLDLWSSPQLKSALYDLLAVGHDRLVVDLSGVGFMDSTGLGVMIGVQQRFSADERMAIAAPQAPVLRVLELSGAGAALRVFATRDAALSYVTEAATSPAGRTTAPLTADAALMLGIASTAMPFAQSSEDQAERWLRALRNHGESGAILASLGLSETAITDPEYDADADGPPAGRGDPDAVSIVTDEATRISAERGAPKVGTLHVLTAVIVVYGPTFYRALAAHGVDPAELRARVAGAEAATSEI
jgi:anti-sigma B factor antagonist